MDIECNLVFIQPGPDCFGDFVDKINSNQRCAYCATCIVKGLNNATAIFDMFEVDCDLYSSDCGFNLGPRGNQGNDLWQITIGVTNEKHLSNLIHLRDTVNSDHIINRNKVIESRTYIA